MNKRQTEKCVSLMFLKKEPFEEKDFSNCNNNNNYEITPLDYFFI